MVYQRNSCCTSILPLTRGCLPRQHRSLSSNICALPYEIRTVVINDDDDDDGKNGVDGDYEDSIESDSVTKH